MKIAVSCLGSRERYGMSVALHKLGMLDVLYTDIYVSHRVSQLRGLRGMNNGLAALLGRNHPDLPYCKVKTYSKIGIAFRFGIRRARHLNEHLSLNVKYGSLFSARVAVDVVHRNLDMLIVFTGAAKETFELLKITASPAIRVLDQVDAGLYDYLLIQDECEKFPEWGEAGELLNQEYFGRVKAEINLADHVIVNSSYSRDMIQNWVGERRISILPIPSSFERKVKSEFPKTSPLKVLFLGTLSLRKGIHYALKAIEQMQQNGLDISLTLAGGCRIKPEMLARYKNINYLGIVPSDVIRSLLDTHDVLLFPTLSEGFGIVQVEAISRSVPVISTKNCGQVVEDGVSGFIINAKCSDSIIEGLSKYYHDRELLAQHSRNAYDRSEFFTIDRYADNLMTCLESIHK